MVSSPPLSVVPGSAPLWQRVRTARIALTELALFVATGVRRAARPILLQLTIYAAVGYARLRRVARRQQRLQGARLHALSISVRNLQWRHHASSFLIATAILIAVARAQTSPDGR